MDALDPRHGTLKGAWAHGNDGEPACEPCREARRKYARQREYARHSGKPGRVPIGADNHTKLLDARNRGWTFEKIANSLGVSMSTIHLYINKGPETMVLPSRRTHLDQWRPNQPITGVGIRRRVEALMWLGYPCAYLSRRAGLCDMTFTEGLREGRTTWRVSVADAVVALYEELWDKPNQPTEPHAISAANSARNRARRRGYVPPMAWDNIDDPNARPLGRDTTGDVHTIDHAVVERLVNGEKVPSTPAEKAEALRKWTAAGRSARSLEDIHGWKQGRYATRKDAA